MSKTKKTPLPAKKIRKNSIGGMLKVISTSLDAKMSKELKHLDLNLGQFSVLMALSEEEGLTQSEIGKKIAMPGYATTRTIDALEARRFVERRKDDRSRRSHRIHLTDQGRNFVPELLAIVSRVNEQLLSALSSKEQKALAAIFKKLVHSRFE